MDRERRRWARMVGNYWNRCAHIDRIHRRTGFLLGQGPAARVIHGLSFCASFLPAWRDKIGLHPGASTHLNITLNTLLNAMRVVRCAAAPTTTIGNGPSVRWRIVPVLRVFDDPNSADGKQGNDLKGVCHFWAVRRPGGYGTGSDMSTGFSLERKRFFP